MNEKLIALAKEYICKNHDKVLEDAEDYCMYEDPVEYKEERIEALKHYEILLRDMADKDQDAEAAIRYLLIAQIGDDENVFDDDIGIQLILKTNAIDAYVRYLNDNYDGIMLGHRRALTTRVITRIAEMSRMSDESDS